jgi:hypothetical protein
LNVYDVSDPSEPAILGSCDIDSYGNLIADGDVVYSVCGYPGLRVYDVSDPAAPAEIGSLDLPGGAQGGAVVGDLLCVANGWHGLTVVDVADPSQPVEVGGRDLPGYARGVACRWPFAYLAAEEFNGEPGGLHVLDITDPSAPVVVFSNEIPGAAVAVALDDEQVVVAAHWGGVMVFRHADVTSVAAPAAAVLLPNYPNPFNPSTTIRWDQAVAGRAEIAVFDLAGRRVRTLVAGERPAGRQRAAWDGRDDRGRAMPAGVYLCRLRMNGAAESRSLTLVR